MSPELMSNVLLGAHACVSIAAMRTVWVFRDRHPMTLLCCWIPLLGVILAFGVRQNEIEGKDKKSQIAGDIYGLLGMERDGS